MGTYILLFAPPGVGLTQITRGISRELDAQVEDIEQCIKEDPHTEQQLTAVGAHFVHPINMETITYHLARAVVEQLWRDAVLRCLQKLRVSDKSIKVLAGHLTYYSGKRSEFYSVIDVDCFLLRRVGQIVLKPDAVLLLIDDIYDMHARLGELYSPRQVTSLLKRYEKEMRVDASSLSRAELCSVTMAWQVRSLLHLLSWRQLETVVAENLALQLRARANGRVRFLLWSVKQLRESLRVWLQAPDGLPIYLSHPISEARRQRNEEGRCPKFAEEVNRLQSVLAEQHITLVMPTGVDERRFEKGQRRYTGALDDRWPLVSDDESTLLYSRPDSADDTRYESLFHPKYWDFENEGLACLGAAESTTQFENEANAYLTLLLAELEAQIASRDFVIVHHAEGVVVYRPYYAGEPRPAFSSGVDAEVRLWEGMARVDPRRRIAFIHLTQDVESMLAAKDTARLILAEYIDALWALLKREAHVDRHMIEAIVRGNSSSLDYSEILKKPLMTERDTGALRQAVRKNWEPAKVHLLRQYLADAVVKVDERLIGIWVADSPETMFSEWANVARFLREGSPRGNDWESSAANLLPDSLIRASPGGIATPRDADLRAHD